MLENSPQELLEFGRGHLARCHLELTVLDRTEASDMAIDRNIVGSVGEHHPHLLAVQQFGVSGLVASIRADQPVIAEMPEVAEPGDRLGLLFRYDVGTVRLHLHCRAIDQQIDFCCLKSCDFQIEVEIRDGQFSPQQLKLLHVPVAVEGNLVVS
jgi:hypothetical protein